MQCTIQSNAFTKSIKLEFLQIQICQIVPIGDSIGQILLRIICYNVKRKNLSEHGGTQSTQCVDLDIVTRVGNKTCGPVMNKVSKQVDTTLSHQNALHR